MGISEELSRTKAAVSACQLGSQLSTNSAAKQADLDELRQEMKRWTEDSQASLADDLLARHHKLVSELRAETTAAFRSEAAAVAALDEQLWLTDQRLCQRIDQLTCVQRENITVIERKTGSPDHVVQQRSSVDDLKEENTVHIRPPPPILGNTLTLEHDREQAVFVERSIRSPRAALRLEEQTHPNSRVRLRYGAAASDGILSGMASPLRENGDEDTYIKRGCGLSQEAADCAEATERALGRRLRLSRDV